MKISKRSVDALQVPETRRWVWDAEIKGFGIVLRPTGTHSFVFNYRDQHGRQRNITIGKVGSMTPDEARKRAEKLRREVGDGRSPLAEKRAARAALTIGDLLDRYLASERFKRKAPSTQTVDRGRIERHLRPLLGKLVVESVSPQDVEAAHAKIVAGKTAIDTPSGKKRGRIIVRGGEGTARMAIRLLRAILSWGRTAKVLPIGVGADLVAGVEIGRDGQRDLILDDPAAYGRLWKMLDQLTNPDALADGESIMRTEVADAIRVIALTGARKGEILGLRWRHIDLRAGTITLPLDAHKTGRKTGQARVIGLPAIAAAVIARQPKGEPDDLVFRPARGGAKLDLTKPWAIVRAAAGLPAGIGLHGLRHSLASHMAMEGAQAAEIMTALGHRDISTSAKYVHWARDRRQELAERAAAGITAAISGVAAGQVVSISEARK
ncbi:site-specific integrase [Rhodopseudomonas pseudopalustris]|uniref:tyrosine-type recombinase/integrase n=1 Tax=Rhodopseudomonas pseudopalustris TaxID=1513892 RepID=UPI003F9D1844